MFLFVIAVWQITWASLANNGIQKRIYIQREICMGLMQISLRQIAEINREFV